LRLAKRLPHRAAAVTLAKRLVSMDDLQEQFDDATFAFSQGEYGQALAGFEAILAADENHFDARMSLSMALCRLEQYERAIEEGHKAEKLRPNDQLVHTNLSLFYVKIGNKDAAEHHGLQSKIASWKQPGAAAAPGCSRRTRRRQSGSPACAKATGAAGPSRVGPSPRTRLLGPGGPGLSPANW